MKRPQFRIKKANGWNKYRIQKRFLFIFWRNADGSKIYTSSERASIRVFNLNYRADLEIKK